MIAFFYFRWGLSLYSFYRISKKERDACIGECFGFSMRYLIKRPQREYSEIPWENRWLS